MFHFETFQRPKLKVNRRLKAESHPIRPPKRLQKIAENHQLHHLDQVHRIAWQQSQQRRLRLSHLKYPDSNRKSHARFQPYVKKIHSMFCSNIFSLNIKLFKSRLLISD